MPKALDITGIRSGRLVAVEPTGERTKDGQVKWLCICDCGRERLVSATNIKSKHSKSCGCLPAENLRGYVGSNQIGRPIGSICTSGNYILEKTESGWVAQHRLIMEKNLGRKLLSVESVHHRDGNKHNNSIENLEVWTHGHPSGMRREDFIEFLYGPLVKYGSITQ